MGHFTRRRWTTIPAPLLSFSVHEGKKFVSLVSGLSVKSIYHGASEVVHLLLLSSPCPRVDDNFHRRTCRQLWQKVAFLQRERERERGNLKCLRSCSPLRSEQTLIREQTTSRFFQFDGHLSYLNVQDFLNFTTACLLRQFCCVSWCRPLVSNVPKVIKP